MQFGVRHEACNNCFDHISKANDKWSKNHNKVKNKAAKIIKRE